jgi:predicted N-formylglutamate amidohydrolase
MARLNSARSPTVVLSCEHASNRVPSRYGNLGLDARTLRTHIAWDIGARDVARSFGRALGCPSHEGRWTRLLVDLNRSATHRKVIAESSFGIEIPGNRGIDARERERRVETYWRPYREAVESEVRATIARAGRCVHLSVHSFTPEVDGRARNADVGILYDPRRRREAELARRWAGEIAAAGLRVRLNYPYRGTADGLCRTLRQRLRASAYVGVEIELNQRCLVDRSSRLHIADVTRTTFLAIVRGSEHAAR